MDGKKRERILKVWKGMDSAKTRTQIFVLTYWFFFFPKSARYGGK